ncbi:glycosyltransferase family 4 protein [Pseudomonas sp. BN414]|uniref:glycosyltransferase family 4 protein n=1 Tax=Pseudomonas sp. BN414 TaxID=2567888 RepID=UPI0024553C7C|nr:glycosyltransferase family 4 protein [Pseudomonas sp. BN414]MDH4568436.1 glycosyltransferase family 4 protein [Pseudomonas sp. BN414]
MKVNILARPDHSVNMYRDLRRLSPSDKINLFTFYATRKGSFLNKILPSRKSVPESVHTSDLLTLLAYTSNMLGRRLGYNWRAMETRLSGLLLPSAKILDCDVLHYWPFYGLGMAKKAISAGNIMTVAEIYEAEPSFVNSIYSTEYDKFGLQTTKKINEMIDQNEVFEFETDFIVASEFTKSSYSRLFPQKNYHVCSYGPAGHDLAPTALQKIEKNSAHGTKRIIFVGQVCVEKGVHYLIEAASQLDVTVDLVGPIRPGQEEVFRKLLASSRNTRALGSMRHQEVLEAMKNYDIFALPSLSDNYSLAVSEALSNGLPVIVTENCGNKDDVQLYNLGEVVKAGDSQALADGITKLAECFDHEKFRDGLVNFFSPTNKEEYVRSVSRTYSKLMDKRS